MITLIGTGHIFDVGQQIRTVIFERQPQVVCVELDVKRYQALRANPDAPKVRAPFLYKMLARMQERLAAVYDTSSGNDMIAAIDAAKAINTSIAFIDVDAAATFKTLFNTMSFSEKIKFMMSGLAGFFLGEKQIEKQVNDFEAHEDAYMRELEKQFPALKKVLIDDRDEYMAHQLKALAEKNERIVAVVGEGHISGIKKRLEGVPLEIITLSELRNGNGSQKIRSVGSALSNNSNSADLTIIYRFE